MFSGSLSSFLLHTVKQQPSTHNKLLTDMYTQKQNIRPALLKIMEYMEMPLHEVCFFCHQGEQFIDLTDTMGKRDRVYH